MLQNACGIEAPSTTQQSDGNNFGGGAQDICPTQWWLILRDGNWVDISPPAPKSEADSVFRSLDGGQTWNRGDRATTAMIQFVYARLFRLATETVAEQFSGSRYPAAPHGMYQSIHFSFAGTTKL